MLIFLLSAFSISAADVKAWEVVFATGTGITNGTAPSTSNKNTFIQSGVENIASVGAVTKCYIKADGGLRICASKTGTSNDGSIVFNLAEDAQVVPTKIIVAASANQNGTTFTLNVNDLGTQSLKGDNEQSYEFKPTSKEPLKTLKLEAKHGSEKGVVMVKSITVYTEGSGDNISAPTFSFDQSANADGEYPAGTKVTLTADEGYSIYYNLNSTADPDNTSTPYTGAITVNETTTIKAIAYVGDKASSVNTTVVSIAVPEQLDPELSWPVSTFTAYLDEDNKFPVLNNPHNLPISYSITASASDIATIDKTTGVITLVGVGSTKVRATYTAPDDSEYKGSWKEYTLNVAKRNSPHETTYTFDFSKKDFGANTVYGMAVHSGSSDNTYEKNTSIIERKGVKLTIIPPSSGNAHRIWDTKGAIDLRMYLSSMTFSVPEGGFIKSVEFTQSGSDWTAPKINDTSTTLSGLKWTAADDVNSVKFTFTAKSFIKGITVTYDLGKPAPPCIVTETETTIHVSCDENCTLEYKKVVHTPKANGPARANSIVDDAADWTPLDGNTVEIEKINEDNRGKQFTFRAKHASGAVSDETAFAVNADGTTTGVESVEAEEADAPVEYFNLQGVRVMNPDKGLFIRRQGNRVEKVMMK